MHHVRQLLGVSRKVQPLFPCSPFMLLSGHSCHGKGRVGVQTDPVAVGSRSVVDTLCTHLLSLCDPREALRHGEKEQKGCLLGVLLELDGFGCFTGSGFPVAVSSGSAGRFFPALMHVAARHGCC